MWVLAMFDLPVDTRAARRAYTQFRKKLLQDGFTRLQFSVYVRHCASEENAEVHAGRVENNLPDDGEVRVLSITDKQFERMRASGENGANRPSRRLSNSSFSDNSLGQTSVGSQLTGEGV